MTIEGKATFAIGSAFYNPDAEIVRDLAVLAAAVDRRDRGSLRVLDAMAGCGVRSLRYVLESQADFVWANDSNSDIQTVLQENLTRSLNAEQYQISDRDAIRVFFDCYNRQDYYDLVDVDGFGSPVPYVHACLSACSIGGLIYLTSTDGRTVTGRAPDNCVADYGAYARIHPAVHEQGLRLILGNVQQQAASRGLGIKPVFSYFTGQTYRVMVRLVSSIQLTEQNYGFLGFCHGCGTYQPVEWRKLGRSQCLNDCRSLVLSGAMWLGNLHDVDQIMRMIEVATEWNWTSCIRLLELMQAEAEMPPYFYTLGEIGRRGKLDIPKSSYLVQTLKDWGHRASLTHIDREAIKTDADLPTCIRAAQSYAIGLTEVD
ncbi:MAG: tRNA (guanine-N1)-methyltransferase [Plectolyngbya sp. WJT66-NPBG17]|jgi:tRNA (guanine26-N2/guanine27-N2)-dimethyltransferase|nr:tRNA (guanine-N1)-methyltransferase [Plectolyngbya sp. WJT66-NPBG17]MBW4527330.1 tRNA (guanine-N1)-methyltransferase [Phormidium tanganyikae FI6-MK23]